jgi:phosphatidylinositol alpha-mannosyltransferase
MRIAIANYYLPRAGNKRGGVDQVAHDLAQGLSGRGHDVTVWSYDPAPPNARYAVRPLPGRWLAENWLGKRLILGYLGNLLQLWPDYGRPDVLIAHGDSLLLPLRHRRLVRVMQGSALGEALSARTPWRFVMQMGVYVQELLTAISQRWVIGISENTRAYNPFVRRVIPIGVDLSKFRPSPERREVTPMILFVGKLDGRKRGALLVNWFLQDVRTRFPDASLHLVCPVGPPYPGVVYHEGVSAQELTSLYQRSWIYASPSNYEGFGLPYLEAMACGTPVIASHNPGSREVLQEGQFGVLADDKSFAARLIDLLGDASQRNKLSAAGLRRASEYSTEKTTARYEQLLIEVTRVHAGSHDNI